MFEANVVERTSKNSGNPYIVIEITFPTGYKKLVFLTDAEKHLIEACK